MPKTAKTKILIIEDDASLLKVLTDMLQLEGFEPLTAINGEEGLKKALSENPDLILLDILMPVMDGLTMLEKLRRANDFGKTVPVIILTNLSADSADVIKKVAKNNPSYYIVKSSLTIQEVVEKIKERLAKQGS
ncbi:MAG: response regulator [Candidatus Doudnabacteria bacterium]